MNEEGTFDRDAILSKTALLYGNECTILRFFWYKHIVCLSPWISNL